MFWRSKLAGPLLLLQLTGCSGDPSPVPAGLSSELKLVPPNKNIPATIRTHPAGIEFATLSVAGRPFGLALSRDGLVYCTLLDAASLTRTSLQAAPPSTLAVDRVPTDVAFTPTGSWAWVTNQHAGTIGLVDTRRHQQVAAVPVEGDPFRVVVGSEGQAVYATTNTGNLVRIDAETRSVSWTNHLGGNLNGLAIDRSGARVYVGDVTGKLYEVSSAGDVLRTLPLPGQPQGLALSSDARELYVAGEAGDLIFLDLERGAEVSRIALGAGGFGISVTPDRAQIWVTAPETGEVLVIDRVSRVIVKRISLGGMPRRLAFDVSGTTAVVADEAGSIRFLR